MVNLSNRPAPIIHFQKMFFFLKCKKLLGAENTAPPDLLIYTLTVLSLLGSNTILCSYLAV